MRLNPSQRQAVETLSGPLLVLAGAGSGKTRVVTYRIARLIQNGTPADRILAVTFTKKAAGEMQQRCAELLGRRRKGAAKPEISTFHSHCVKVLRRHISRLGYPDTFTVYDRGDQESAARAALREIKVPDASLRPGDLLAIISNWKTASVRPAQAAMIAGTMKEHLAASAYRRYQQALKNAAAVDFDDLLLLTEELFASFPEARREEAERFDHLLIDEYQDTNGTQYRIVKALARDHRNLCVVGDDDQSIYGWRGAEVRHILRFQDDWPEAAVVRLEENYRSTAPILEMANRLIRFNTQRHAKVLRAARPGGQRPRILQFADEEVEARAVAEEIRAAVQAGVKPQDFAILFRTNEQTRAFETQLRRLELPYVVVGGMSFFDRKEVRDVLAYLKALRQPLDEISLLRIINTPPRGLGQTAVARLMAVAVEQSKPLWDVLALPGVGGLSSAAQQAARAFHDLLQGLRRQLRQSSLVDAAQKLLAEIDYEQELVRLYEDADERQIRWNAVQEVINAMAAYEEQAEKPSLSGFLDEITLDGPGDRSDKESKLQREAVVLMTLHSAKGLEFPRVYLVGMEEGILPHRRSLQDMSDASIDEERRLCYVGVTRARDRLTMTLPLARRKWGKLRDTIPSRFLFEMTGQADSPAAVAARAGRTYSKRKQIGNPKS